MRLQNYSITQSKYHYDYYILNYAIFYKISTYVNSIS